jgi:PPOX class probable F420-dependent enzyme
VVPVCYALDGTSIVIALDDKPKRRPVRDLERVRNLLARPGVALVVDHYAEDWSQLGFVLLHGRASLIEPADAAHAQAVARLRARYAQYNAMRIDQQPIIAIAVERVSTWGELAPGSRTAGPGRAAMLDVVRGRRSVRAYTDQPVPRPLLEACIEAACWAPSPHGRQPWRFAIITDQGWKVRLADSMAQEWQRNLALDGQPAAVIQTRLAKARARVMNAPALVLACLYLADLDVYPDQQRQQAEQTMAVQSLGAALQNLLLTAYHLGLDGGWMCAPLFCPETVVAALDLDPHLIPHALITLGYAAQDPIRRPRRPTGDLIVFDA